MEKILHTSTPKANREHLCEVCGKPICKGEIYLNIAIKRDGKLVNRKTHLGCSKKGEKTKVTANHRIPITEEQFKQQIHNDTLTMLETFTFRENMDIAFTPLIITEVAWHFTFKVLKQAADNRIEDTKKLSRAIKALRVKFLSDCRKDLDDKHIKRIENVANLFIKENLKDFMLLWFSANNELKKNWAELPYLGMRTDACISLCMLEILRQHNQRIDKLMSSKLGHDVPAYRNPINDSLEDCMAAFISPAVFGLTEHVKTSIKILHKRLELIEYDVK